MKEAPNSPYAKLVFREPFLDEQSVRSNGGVPTAITFSNGVGSFNGTTSYIKYNKNLNGVYSVRIKVKSLNPSSSCTYVDFRNSSGTGVGYLTGGNLNLGASSGTAYVNGVASAIVNATSSDIVITGITINCFEIFLNTRYNLTNYLYSDIELFEIYQGTLTASEVKNLYDNNWNKELVGLNGQTLGNNLMINGTFDTNVDNWNVTRATLTWQPGGFCRLTQNQTETASMAINQPGLTTGKRYLITFDAKSPVITSKPGVAAAHYGDIIAISNPDLSPNWQKYAFEATSKISLLNVYLPTNTVSPGTVVDVDNISVVELQPNLLLDYDVTNGYITDRTGKNTLTLTGTEAINIVKNGGYSALRTNTGFKQVLGSNIINTQPITVVYWANYNSIAIARYFMDNGNFFIDGSTLNRLRVRSDGSSSGISALNFITLGKTQFIAITRATDGTVTFYKGDLQNAPVSSGTANSGTPAATSTPLTLLGLTTSNVSGFDGKMMMIKVFDGILDLETITQIWSSTRGKVN